MSHQPYENWLLELDAITPQQEAELQAHLRTCPDCAGLQAGWQGVRLLMDADDDLPVPAGFTARWQASLPERKAQHRAAQIRRMLYFLGGGIFLASLALIAVTAVTTTPAELIHRLILLVTGLGATLKEGQSFFSYLFRSAPAPLLVFLGLALAGWIFILSLTWVFTILRFSASRETNQ